MKKIILISVMLFVTVSSFCQNEVKSEMTKSDYLRKSKNYKITAGVILGSGLAISAVGGLIQLHDNAATDWIPDFRGAYVAIAGGCVAVISTPFFILSGANKRKAAAISLNQQTILLPGRSNMASLSMPAVSLQVYF
jgi:hypothetical protein